MRRGAPGNGLTCHESQVLLPSEVPAFASLPPPTSAAVGLQPGQPVCPSFRVACAVHQKSPALDRFNPAAPLWEAGESNGRQVFLCFLNLESSRAPVLNNSGSSLPAMESAPWFVTKPRLHPALATNPLGTRATTKKWKWPERPRSR